MTGATCEICKAGELETFREVDGLRYDICKACGSICADKVAYQRAKPRAYDDSYWSIEIANARDRSYGGTLARVAEVFAMCRIPITRFLDISSGGGSLLDALCELLPEIQDVFHGNEPFPPPASFRSAHPNYKVGYISDLEGRFDAGVCIEVIEHLFPATLREMLAQLATKSNAGALYYFNSGQPVYVIQQDPGYLDPFARGHVVSYSVPGAAALFAEAGFTIHPFPGRAWGFLAEYKAVRVDDGEALMNRLWHPVAANTELLNRCKYGKLFQVIGSESARCFLESARADTFAAALARQSS